MAKSNTIFSMYHPGNILRKTAGRFYVGDVPIMSVHAHEPKTTVQIPHVIWTGTHSNKERDLLWPSDHCPAVRGTHEKL